MDVESGCAFERVDLLCACMRACVYVHVYAGGCVPVCTRACVCGCVRAYVCACTEGRVHGAASTEFCAILVTARRHSLL